MNSHPDILCIGSVLWDVIGRANAPMKQGNDVPGRIRRLPGGVAMNIAMTLRRFDMRPALLTAIGNDEEGRTLMAACHNMGILTDYVHLSDDLPTDQYMAIEDPNGLIAAIADAHSLEAAGDKILTPLSDGRLGTQQSPYSGIIALDGNLTTDLLSDIACSPLFQNADLRVAPASPGKADRLDPLMNCPNATLYVNLEEASILCGSEFDSSQSAAAGMIENNTYRVLVTDGEKSATYADKTTQITASPPLVTLTRVTGAGDTFMAAHIVAQINGQDAEQALNTAVQTAAKYVSGEDI